MNNQRKRPRPHAPPETQDPSTSALDFHVRAYEATLVYGQERFAELLRLPEDRGGHSMRWIGDSGGVEHEHGSPGGRDLWIDRYPYGYCHVFSILTSHERLLVARYRYMDVGRDEWTCAATTL
jgi:hypothetical protein